MKLVVRPPDDREAFVEPTQEEIEASYGFERKLCACGRMFTPYRSFQRYCCDAHRIKYSKGKASGYVKKPKVEKACKECGKKFVTNDSKRHYCSPECYEQYQLKRRKAPEERVCMVCGKTFVSAHWSKRYCSAVCRKEAHDGR
jgi:hypothetical protein